MAVFFFGQRSDHRFFNGVLGFGLSVGNDIVAGGGGCFCCCSASAPTSSCSSAEAATLHPIFFSKFFLLLFFFFSIHDLLWFSLDVLLISI